MGVAAGGGEGRVFSLSLGGLVNCAQLGVGQVANVVDNVTLDHAGELGVGEPVLLAELARAGGGGGRRRGREEDEWEGEEDGAWKGGNMDPAECTTGGRIDE